MLKKSLSLVLTLALILSSMSGLLAFNAAALEGDPVIGSIDYSSGTAVSNGITQVSLASFGAIAPVDGQNALLIGFTQTGYSNNYNAGWSVDNSVIGDTDTSVTIMIEYKLINNTSGNTRFRLNYQSTVTGNKNVDTPWYTNGATGWTQLTSQTDPWWADHAGDRRIGITDRNTWSVMTYTVPDALFLEANNGSGADFQLGTWLDGTSGDIYVRSIKVLKNSDYVATMGSLVAPDHYFYDFNPANLHPELNPYFPQDAHSYGMNSAFNTGEGSGVQTATGMQITGMLSTPVDLSKLANQPNVKIRYTFADANGATSIGSMQYDRIPADPSITPIPNSDRYVSPPAFNITDNVAEVILTDASFRNDQNAAGSFRTNLTGMTLSKIEIFVANTANKAALQAAAKDNVKTDLTPYTSESATDYTNAVNAGLAVFDDIFALQHDVDSAVTAINDAKSALVLGAADVASIDYSGDTTVKAGMDETFRDAGWTIDEIDGKNALHIPQTAKDRNGVGYAVSKDIVGATDTDVTMFVEYKLVNSTDNGARFRINFASTTGMFDTPWYVGWNDWAMPDWATWDGSGDKSYGRYVNDAWSIAAFSVPKAKFNDDDAAMDFQLGAWLNGTTGDLYIRNIKVDKTADITATTYSNAFYDFVKSDYSVNNLYPNGPKNFNNMSWQKEGTINVNENGASGDGYIICPLTNATSYGATVKVKVTFSTPPTTNTIGIQYNMTGSRAVTDINDTTIPTVFHGANMTVTGNTAEIVMNDAEFANKANGGSFRINGFGTGVVSKIEVLQPGTFDKAALAAAISAANDKKNAAGYSDYSQATRDTFEAALTTATTVNGDAFTDQATINSATTDLTTAQDALVVAGIASIDFSVAGYVTTGNFTMPDDYSKGVNPPQNFVPVGDTGNTNAYRMYKHNNGFSVKPNAGVFEDQDFLKIEFEYYWPAATTADNSRLHGESGSKNLFTMRKGAADGVITPAGMDSWQTYTSNYVIRGSEIKDNGIKLMFWEANEATESDESVFIKNFKIVKTDAPALDFTELQKAYNNRQDSRCFTDESKVDYDAAVAAAKAILDDHTSATWDTVDAAIKAMQSAAAKLVIKDGVYTVANTSWDKHELSLLGQKYSGRLTELEGYYCWEMPEGTSKFIGIADPNGILTGEKNITFEYDYYIPATASGNSRFFAGHGTTSEYINVSEAGNGYSVSGGSPYQKATTGAWTKLSIVMDNNGDTSKLADDGAFMRIGWWADGADHMFVKGLKAYATNEPSKVVSLTFNVAPVDTAALQAAVDEGNGLIEADYTTATWTPFKAKLDDAQAVLDNADHTQAEVDAALAALNTAKAGLITKAAQAITDAKAALKTVIDAAKAKVQAEYTDASWTPFAAKLADADAVYANTGKTVDEINAAKAALQTAMDGLVLKPVVVDKTALKALIDACNALNEDDYTVESWTALQTALTAAQAAYDKATATQAEVDTAKTALQTAKDTLVPDESVPGDISGDGDVTITDARIALQASVGKITLTDAQMEIADVNFDGDVTITDARILLQFAVGKIAQLPTRPEA